MGHLGSPANMGQACLILIVLAGASAVGQQVGLGAGSSGTASPVAGSQLGNKMRTSYNSYHPAGQPGLILLAKAYVPRVNLGTYKAS